MLSTAREASIPSSPNVQGNPLGLLAGGWSGDEAYSAGATAPAAVGHFVFTLVHGGETVLIDYERRVAGKVCFRGHGICRRGSAAGELILQWWDTDRTQETVLAGWEDDGRAILSTSGRSRVRWSLACLTDDLLTLAIAESRDGTNWEVQRISTYHRCAPATR